MHTPRGWLWVVLLALGLALAAPVAAQSSGGSFGGGSFSGGGGSFGGGGSSFSGGGSSFSSFGSRSRRNPSRTTFALTAVITGLSVALGLWLRRKEGDRARHHATRSWNDVDVSVVQIGIDWRARAAIQSGLREIAEGSDLSTKPGLSRALRAALSLIREHRISWLYAHVTNHRPMSAASAEGIFRQHTIDARAAFRDELVRNVDGDQTSLDASYRAHPHEGEGVVVVTLVVASEREILDAEETTDAGQLALLLDELRRSGAPFCLTAMEVIWSPAADDDRMSTAELEQHYPQLKKIDESSIGGRRFCGFCRGPYAEELGECPHCGAPA